MRYSFLKCDKNQDAYLGTAVTNQIYIYDYIQGVIYATQFRISCTFPSPILKCKINMYRNYNFTCFFMDLKKLCLTSKGKNTECGCFKKENVWKQKTGNDRRIEEGAS
jgi:hypothetical protein